MKRTSCNWFRGFRYKDTACYSKSTDYEPCCAKYPDFGLLYPYSLSDTTLKTMLFNCAFTGIWQAKRLWALVPSSLERVLLSAASIVPVSSPSIIWIWQVPHQALPLQSPHSAMYLSNNSSIRLWYSLLRKLAVHRSPNSS